MKVEKILNEEIEDYFSHIKTEEESSLEVIIKK